MPRPPFSPPGSLEDEDLSGPPPDVQSPWVLLRSANKHPFIFRRMLREVDPVAKAGDVVNVYDKSGLVFGRGIFHPKSQIALRMLTHGDVPVDDAFWSQAIRRAVEFRKQMRLDEVTDAYRVVHAEGDGLSGLIVERYADHLVFEFFSLGMYQRRDMLAAHLMRELGTPTSLDRPKLTDLTWQVVLRADNQIEQIEGFKIPTSAKAAQRGATPLGPRAAVSNTLTIREHGIRYRVDAAGGHKTGFFCDQRDNRKRFAELCKGSTVLDLCCYTGGFGICAKVLGEAKEVTSVDLDEAALVVAKENVNLNNARVSLVHSDAFIYLRQMLANGRQFDAVVLDPPKFVRDREEMEDGLRRYHDLNSLAMQIVRPGGYLLTCSCSGLVGVEAFTETVQRATRPARRSLQMFAQSGAAADHPVMLTCPESAYLKALWFRVM
ncbi:MAG: class I SAM-dependent rRNA methyltransferase [Planctomycetes bacterium]|nr:class I SAM-dependent rRNA methyltransferase [Planctomycetota bacterium]